MEDLFKELAAKYGETHVMVERNGIVAGVDLDIYLRIIESLDVSALDILKLELDSFRKRFYNHKEAGVHWRDNAPDEIEYVKEFFNNCFYLTDMIKLYDETEQEDRVTPDDGVSICVKDGIRECNECGYCEPETTVFCKGCNVYLGTTRDHLDTKYCPECENKNDGDI